MLDRQVSCSGRKTDVLKSALFPSRNSAVRLYAFCRMPPENPHGLPWGAVRGIYISGSGVTIRLADVYINVFQLYESTGNACQFFEKKLFTQDSSPRKRQVHHVYHQTVQSFSSETISEMGLSSDRTQPAHTSIDSH